MLDPVYRKRCGMSSSSPHKQKYHKIRYCIFLTEQLVFVCLCGPWKMHRLWKCLLMCFQLGTDVSLVQSVERRAAAGGRGPGESVFTPAGAAHGHQPQPHHQKTLLEGNMQLCNMHSSSRNEHFPHKILFICSSVTGPLSFPGENAGWKLSERPGRSPYSWQTSVSLVINKINRNITYAWVTQETFSQLSLMFF